MHRLILSLLLASQAFAAITGMEVIDRRDVTGDYERVRARAFFAVDPKLAQNQRIRDLEFAETNAQGLVEFTADVEILKPRDPRKSNGTLILDVVNRGGKVLPGTFSETFLMENRFIAAWVGWQWDSPPTPGRILLQPAVAKGLEGVIRAEFTPDAPGKLMNLGDRDHVAYPVANPADPKLELTVRTGALGKRTAIPRSKWKLNAAATGIEFADGFQPGKTYELIYKARDPKIAGLGFAAVRDLVSFLRYGGPGQVLLADQRQGVKRAIAFGTSQSGRFLRHMLYDNFNEDERGRMVFDGVWANVAGAGRGSFNHRFAQASRDGHPTMNFLYPTDLAPYSDDGLLANTKHRPKIFYTNGSYEYWGRAASLIHTNLEGTADAAAGPDTRIYFVAGSQHGPQSFPPERNASYQNLRNSVDYRPLYRALLMAMHEWIKDKRDPPASNYPLLAKGQLMAAKQLKFPKGITPPVRTHAAYDVDYGPEFASKGIVTLEPPKVKKAYTVLVPQVDDEGNEIAGVKMPQVAVPLATYTGWNPRAPKLGLPGETYNMVGSTLPFAKERILERYMSKEQYLAKVQAVIDQLVADRLLLAQEAPTLAANAAQQWDWFILRVHAPVSSR